MPIFLNLDEGTERRLAALAASMKPPTTKTELARYWVVERLRDAERPIIGDTHLRGGEPCEK